MKIFYIFLRIVCFFFLCLKSTAQIHDSKEISKVLSQKKEWFVQDKFGMFIHWGLYAIPAGYWNGKSIPGPAEWIMYEGKIPVKDYEQLAKEFNPVSFNADRWVSIAKEAGMKYLVFTAKHCDGFAMYHSRVSPYNVVNATPYKKDILQQIESACKKSNLKLGFYYSHNWDWHEKNAQGLENTWDFPDTANKNQEIYFQTKALPQVKELVTGYSPDLIWFDVPTTIKPMQSKAFFDTIIKYRPNCIINDRIGNGYGDYLTPEQYVPSQSNKSLFESCMTLNDTWGYKVSDWNWKTSSKIIFNLVDLVSKGGNYLLNVGPDEKGNLPDAAIITLKEVGNWMLVNGRSIYETKASPLGPLPFGFCTAGPGSLFLHVFNWPENGKLVLPGVNTEIKKIYLLADAKKTMLTYEKISNQDISINLNLIAIPKHLLNEIDNVIVVEHENEAKINTRQLVLNEGAETILRVSNAIISGDSLRYIFNDRWDETRGYITDNWKSKTDKMSWNYRLLKDGWFTVELEFSAPESSNGSTFEITVNSEKIESSVENTGGYYSFKRKTLGRIYLKKTNDGILQIGSTKELNTSLMNLASITLIPVPRQALVKQ